MNKIKIAFTDFWAGFEPETQWFYPLIAKEFDTCLVSSRDKPDILFYSCSGTQHLNSNAQIRIYFTGENDIPNFNLCDYAISFHNLIFGNRHLRLPLYAMYPSFDILRIGKRETPSFDRDFCSFVVSNNFCADPIRMEFYEQLSKYKHIASGGRHANNIGGPVKDKHKFLTNYKFNIAFENSSVHGYTTEKLADALAAATLPIYWGNPDVNLDFAENCFIDISKFKTIGEAIEFIEKVDNDESLYMSYFQNSPLQVNQYLNWEEIFINFMRDIVISKQKYMITSGIGNVLLEQSKIKEQLFKFGFLKKHIELLEKLSKIKNSLLH